MSDSDSVKQSHAWRSRFRSRHHEAAHELQVDSPVDAGGRADVAHGKATIVARQDDLAALLERLHAAGSFAYDSEFIGEMSYVPKLCVLQIATTSEIALVDPLAEVNLTPLWELMADAGVEKVVHAGAQDMEPVLRLTGKPAANVVDTQIAAGFASLPYPVSLQRLVMQMLNVKLGKGLTFTHWDQRPLSAQQLRYAADDVRYLPAVWAELKKIVQERGALAWVQQECIQMCVASPYTFDPETSYQRVRGAGTLRGKQLGALRELTIWRNEAALAADLPPRTFLKDEVLVDLARRGPASVEKLGDIQGLPRPVRSTQGERIIVAIGQGQARPADTSTVYQKVEEMPRQQFQTDAIHALAQAVCMARGIDPQLVLSRSDTGELIHRMQRGASVADLRIMQGWRRELLGQTLEDLYREGGGIRLRVRDRELSATKESAGA